MEGTEVPQSISAPEATGPNLHRYVLGAMARAAAKRLEGQSAAMSGSAQAGPQGRGTRIPAVGQCAHPKTRRQAQADTQGRAGGAKRSGTADKQARKGRDGCRCKSAVEVREASRRSSSRRGCERRRRPDRPCPPKGGARHSGDWWQHQSPFVFLGDFSALPARSKRAPFGPCCAKIETSPPT